MAQCRSVRRWSVERVPAVRAALIVATIVLAAACGDTQPGAGPTDGTGVESSISRLHDLDRPGASSVAKALQN